MINNIIEDIQYKNIMENQIFTLVTYLLETENEFSITANKDGITFDPELPASIQKNFVQFTLFTLVNYTYESIVLTEKTISFEAGFGEENFGSVVTIPLYAILQIVIEDSILLLNPTATVAQYFEEEELKEEEKEGQISRSMNAFTMNSKNKNLLH